MHKSEFWVANWEKLVAVALGVLFIGAMVALAYLVPKPTATQWFVFRVVLALAAGGVAAVIPGFITANVSKSIRAGGALGVFLLVYWMNPPRLVATSEGPSTTSINQTTGGQNSPAVVSGGDVTITNQNNEQKKGKKKK